MKRAFIFERTAVLVFDWYEPDPDGDDEHGVRVEIRLLGNTDHRGSPSAAQEVVLDQPVFRADLFDLIAGEPGNFLRAHYHPSFDGVEPSERRWDASLSADPLGWLVAGLSDLEGVFAKSSAASFVPEEALRADADALRRVVGEVITVAELVLAQVRGSNSQTTAAEARRPRGTATADGAESVGPGLCGPAPRTTAD